VAGFLARHGLEGEILLNLEANHATLAGHSFHHEVATALSIGILGSVDANRGDPQNGWDTDQFPNSVEELTPVLYEILAAGGLTTGGFNFDTKLRRQSSDRDDLFHGHVGAVDTLARALLAAASLQESGELAALRDQRYAGWGGPLGTRILDGDTSLVDLHQSVLAENLEPTPVSGRQELLENLVNRHVERAR
jgi:xylose isomerase